MSRLKAARVQVDERALALARLGEDGAREARPRFRSVGAVATWYFATQRRLGAPKTWLAATTELLALGCHVDGGVGSVIEADLVLAADVEACLPVPPGPPGPGAAWRAWRRRWPPTRRTRRQAWPSAPTSCSSRPSQSAAWTRTRA
ncbi:MAG: hypothetical protein AMXMBFR64_45420 [Myxococcales bacterium]